MPDAPAEAIIRTEDGTWTAARVVKNYDAVIFHAASERDADSSLSTVEARIGGRGQDGMRKTRDIGSRRPGVPRPMPSPDPKGRTGT